LYLSLFISAFAAATILPAQSEAVLAYHAAAHPEQLAALIAVATAGNVLGAMVNWWLGRFAHHFKNKRWFPVSVPSLMRAERFYRRYGRYSLLLSWVPIIGDPITIIAGVMREPLWSFMLLVSLSKSVRYLFVAGVVSALFA